MDDPAAMEHALALAERARGRVSPNPPVGCAVVADGELVGEGWTQPPPGPHAERVALDEAGDAARGGTAYVTLEPCAHQGRTAPCVDALIEAGLARVVYAAADPAVEAAGGAERLRAAGVAVEHDARAEPAAARQLAAHLHAAATGRPLVVVKLAVSVDGRLAAPDGTSQWLTGPEARRRAHRARALADAVVVGAGTAAADDPRLTAREPDLDRGGAARGADGGPAQGASRGWDGPQPLRVVLDAHARLSPASALADVAAAPTLVAVGPEADPARLTALRAAGVETLELAAERADGADLRALLAHLWKRDVREVLVEGGATVAGAVVAAGLADRLEVHLAGVLLGDAALPAVRGLPAGTLAEAPRFAVDAVERCGDDLVISYVARGAPEGG